LREVFRNNSVTVHAGIEKVGGTHQMSIVTTYLEMRSPDQLRSARCADERFQVREKKEPDWRFNRDLYFAVGEHWSWIEKHPWTDEQWKEYGLAPQLRTFGAYHSDSLAGYYELRRDDEGGAVELEDRLVDPGGLDHAAALGDVAVEDRQAAVLGVGMLDVVDAALGRIEVKRLPTL